MLKLFRTFSLALIAGAAISSCTGVRSSIREPYSRVDFVKSDFEFSAPVTATATQTLILGIDFSRLFRKQGAAVTADISQPGLIASLPVIGTLLENKVSGYAVYNLMQANPTYDVVFYPQYTVTRSRPIIGIPFIYEQREATVKARMARIK